MSGKRSKSTELQLFASSDDAKEMDREAKIAIKEVLKLQMPEKLKNVLLHHLIWQVTVADGKYITRYRSEGAYHNKEQEDLRHEHVYTIKWLRQELLKTPEAKLDDVLEKVVACIVTESEHGKLDTKSVGAAVGWERYSKAGIKVFDMSMNPPQPVTF